MNLAKDEAKKVNTQDVQTLLQSCPENVKEVINVVLDYLLNIVIITQYLTVMAQRKRVRSSSMSIFPLVILFL